MTKNAQIEISCIGPSYLQPTFDLAYTLSKMEFSGKSRIRASSHENGYAASIVTLVVFCIESLINNLRYRSKDRKIKNETLKNKRIDALHFFVAQYPDEVDLIEDLTELFTLRNAIAHSHLWKTRVRLTTDYDERIIARKLLPNYGDRMFEKVVDMRKRKTKKLHLNIIPTRVGISEAHESLRVLYKFSEFLDNQNLRFISNRHFTLGKELLSFEKCLMKLEVIPK